MKIALAPVSLSNGDIACNAHRMKHYMEMAKAQNAQLICFGESYLQGFNCLSWNFTEDKGIAVSVDGPVFRELCSWTEQIGIDLLFGFMELDGEAIYSSCALISEGEILHKYRRISKGWRAPSATAAHYREGSSVDCFRYHHKKCVIGLCGDVWDYPEQFSQGQDLFFWSVYVEWTEEEWLATEKQAYAGQANACCRTTLYVNSICGNETNGGAALFENGTVQAETAMGREKLLLVDIA